MHKTVKNGIVAYFDILGYKEFILKNPPEYCVEMINEVFKKVPEDIKTHFLSCGRQDKIYKEIENYFINHHNVLILSDTIIFFFDIDSIETDNISTFLHQILYYLIFFMNTSFNMGFPMRGCIEYGDYLYDTEDKKIIFAGRAIANCNNETNNLNFSGLVMTNAAHKLYCDYKDKPYVDIIFGNNIIKDYLVDTKNGETIKYLVNFMQKYECPDLMQYIFNCFHEHKKEINNNVMDKIRNTEIIFRHFICNNDLLRKKFTKW